LRKSSKCCGLGLRCPLLCYTWNNALATSVSTTEMSTALPPLFPLSLCFSQRSPSDSGNADDQDLSEALWFLCSLEFHENVKCPSFPWKDENPLWRTGILLPVTSHNDEIKILDCYSQICPSKESNK